MQAENILEGLNPEQKEAVTYNNGPLIIIAGAGTGKTSVITRKIAYLIAEGRAKSKEILALTFTKKAAQEMEERVDILLPLGYNDVSIKTFHSLAEEFLKENAYELGFSTNFKVMTDISSTMLVKEHIFDFDLRYYRPLSDPTRFIKDLLSLFSRAKDELISPEEYIALAEKKIAEAESIEVEADREEAEKMLEVARAYRTYQELLITSDRMDFGDLVYYMIKALKEKPSLLRKFRQKYRYILVDEFQDTNYGQNELLKVIALSNSSSKLQAPDDKQIPNSKSETQNQKLPITDGQLPIVTVVGDDDQSIYKFRGASISNILAFEKDWGGVKRVILTRNYRSTQAILDCSYGVIKNNNPDRLEARYGIDKKLISVAENGRNPQLLSCDTETDEANTVATIIKELKEREKVSLSDVAILVRSNSQATAFINALASKRVPYIFSGAEGLFRRLVVRNIISFLSILSNPSDNLALFNLLTSDIVGVDYEALSVILHKVRSQNIALERYLRDQKNIDINEGEKAKIDSILNVLDSLRREGFKKNTGEILYDFLEKSGYLKELSSLEKEGSIEAGEKIISIANFFDHIKSFQDLNLDTSIQKFMDYLNALLEIGEEVRDSIEDSTFEAVRVLTIHKAKGLEFDHVFLVGMVEDRMPSRRRSEPIELPIELIKETLPEGDAHIQEERRLFYVGMTRAKKELYFTAARDYGGKRSKKISRYVLEAVGEENIPQGLLKPSAIERIAHFQSSPEPAYSSRLKIKDGKLRLSRAEVDDYLTCPRKYKYIHITPIRLMTDPRVIFGRAVHKVIEEFYKNRLQAKELSIDQLLEIYQQNWSSEGFLSAEHEQMRFDEGKVVIRKFYEEYHKLFDVIEIEKKFTFTLDDIIIEGRIDIVEELKDGGIRIIDFKTSDIDDQPKAEKRAKESKQLAIYALAIEENEGKMPEEVGLFFLGTGILGTATPTAKTLEATKESIRQAASGIREQNFLADPDKMKCAQCPFSRYCDDSVV